MNETPLLMACAAATTISQVATLPGSISSFVLRRASTLSANAQSACSLAQCACMQASACAPTASRSFSTRRTNWAVDSFGRCTIWYSAHIWRGRDSPNYASTKALKLRHVVVLSRLGCMTAHAASPKRYMPSAWIAVTFKAAQ